MNIKERNKYNTECMNKLLKFLEENPDLRFIQALWALNIISNEDRFYEEPDVTLEKIQEALKTFSA